MNNPNLLIISNRFKTEDLQEEYLEEVKFTRWDENKLRTFNDRHVLIIDFSFDNDNELNYLQNIYMALEERLREKTIEEGLIVIVICGYEDKEFYVEIVHPKDIPPSEMTGHPVGEFQSKFSYSFLRKLSFLEGRLECDECNIQEKEVERPFKEYFNLTDRAGHVTLRYEIPQLDTNIKIKPISKTFRNTCVGGIVQTGKGFLILLPSYDKSKKKEVLLSLIEISRDFYIKQKHMGIEVDPAIPHQIASDYLEALLCRNVGAYKAVLTMCRRALQSSAEEMGATKSTKDKTISLHSQINELFSKRKITEPVCNMAIKIKQLGNIGAHPDRDELKDISEKDVEEILNFISAYFQCVYIIPKNIGE